MRSHANRGMAFEMVIEHTNMVYFMKGWAVVQKVPNSWKVVRRGKKIVSAFPEKKSTVDFVGASNGRPIAFDAKSTRERTRFPLSNIEQHQFEFLRSWQDQGGVAFLLVEFAALHEVYYVTFSMLEKYWIDSFRGGRQSIPYNDIYVECDPVQAGRGVALDYLKCLG